MEGDRKNRQPTLQTRKLVAMTGVGTMTVLKVAARTEAGTGLVATIVAVVALWVLYGWGAQEETLAVPPTYDFICAYRAEHS